MASKVHDNNERKVDSSFMFGYVSHNNMPSKVTKINSLGIMETIPTNITEAAVEKDINPKKPTYRQV